MFQSCNKKLLDEEINKVDKLLIEWKVQYKVKNLLFYLIQILIQGNLTWKIDKLAT